MNSDLQAALNLLYAVEQVADNCGPCPDDTIAQHEYEYAQRAYSNERLILAEYMEVLDAVYPDLKYRVVSAETREL